MRISPARTSAFEILLKIEKESAFSSILLPHYEAQLEKKDAALCHAITLGVLRKKLYLDRIIEKLTGKTISKFDAEVVISLEMGLYQMLFMKKIPAYSAINESVNIVKAARKKSASGLVNAVLRRACREPTKLDFSDKLERISIETSHPLWLIKKWIRQYGVKAATSLAFANNRVPRLVFRFTKRYQDEPPERRRRVLSELDSEHRITESEFVADCYMASGFSQMLRELVEGGMIYFQGEASQMVSKIVGLKSDESFIDLCAAPGSKFTQIAKHRNADSLTVTGDLHYHRLETLRANCKKQRILSPNIVQYNAHHGLPFADESFDVILIDAPCSGTGTIRRNPEIRYSLTETEIKALSRKQLTILKNASKLTKIGGRVIYSTCSLEKEENHDVVKRFLLDSENFEIVESNVTHEMFTAEGFVQTDPVRDDTDGFFVAVLVRRK